MATFDDLSNKFNDAINEFGTNSQDDRSWSLLDARQFEIMDSVVDNSKKAEAFDRVLWEISRIHPHANTYYCKALEKRLAVADKKNPDDMERIAKDAYVHKRGVDFMLYGKIINDVYQLSKDKENFPFKSIVQSYRKNRRSVENKLGREQREEDLRRIDFDLDDPMYDPEQKLNKIEEALTILKEEKYFGPIKSNEAKHNYCRTAVRICREELGDTDTADYYLDKAKMFKKRADKASLEWAKKHGKPYQALEEIYKQKYRTDRG